MLLSQELASDGTHGATYDVTGRLYSASTAALARQLSFGSLFRLAFAACICGLRLRLAFGGVG